MTRYRGHRYAPPRHFLSIDQVIVSKQGPESAKARKVGESRIFNLGVVYDDAIRFVLKFLSSVNFAVYDFLVFTIPFCRDVFSPATISLFMGVNERGGGGPLNAYAPLPSIK